MPLDSDTLGLVFTHDGELLHGAAIYDQDTLLNDLLNAGGNGTVKSRDPLGRTPLHTAASHGSVKCVRVLLQRGADPNANSGIEDDCSTPVHQAAKNGHIECLAALLEYEVNLDLKDSKGRRAVDIALEEGRSECLKCANYIKKVKEQRQKEIESAKCEELYDVIDDGLYENARMILESMVDPYSAVNRYYRGPNTLLYRASINGQVEIVQLLIDYNADGRPNADSGITPTYAAAFAGHLSVVVLLSKVYPKHLVMPVTVDETYPLHAAVMKDRIEIIKYLLTLRHGDRSASRKFSHQENSSGNDYFKKRSSTALDLHKDVTTQQFCVDVNQPMKSGYTSLHLAVMYGSVEIINCLLHCKPIISRTAGPATNGALIIDAIANNMTPFHHALLLGKVEIANELLKYGANLLEKFDDGDTQCTPLQYACKCCSEEMVKMLLAHGAKDNDDAARIEAMNTNKDNIVQILLSNGVFEDEEGKVICAASEISLDLKPVIIQWEKRKLDSLKEDWLLNAGISCNLHVREKLLHDPSLRVKVFTTINLANNNLESLPIILFQMPSLKKLNVSHNKLKNLPGPSNDKSKRSIVMDDPDKSSTLSENWNCPSLEELDLQHNFFTILSKNVFTMPSLKTVNASWNRIKSLPFEIWIAPSLKNLILEHNELKWLPAFMNRSSSLENQEPKKENFMKDMPENQQGDDKKVDFSTVPQAHSKRPTWNEDSDDDDEEDVDVVKKSGLHLLDLSDNHFTCVPIGLSCLAPNLSKLSLRKNRITEITSISLLPEHLYNLDISANGLKVFDFAEVKDRGISICYAVVKKQPQQRNMSQPIINRKYCHHCKHKQLVDLSRLVLSNNQLEHLPLLTLPHEDNTKNQASLFPVLKTLDIMKNKLTKFPSGVGKLKNLCSLYISHNPNIESLPYELGLCSSLYELKLENLPIKDPPKNILEKRFSDIRSLTGYLKSLHDKAEVYPNIKLMIVGIHGIGKTTLLEALRKEGTGPYQQTDHRTHFSERQTDKAIVGKLQGNRSTVGVDVCVWYFSKGYRDVKIKFSTWDFAGQTEYYATHQCFLSRRALYLVLWKLTDGIKGIKQLERWLLNIQARAPNSTVLIIGTYLDEIDRKKRGYVEKMQAEIRARFMSIRNGGAIVNLDEKGLPNVVGVMEVSCKNGSNIQKLRDLIYDTAMNLRVDGKEGGSLLLDKPIPASYIAVEKAVLSIGRTLKNEMPVLDRVRFKQMVYEHLETQGVELRNGDEELNQAVRFLHDYGTLLHYDDPSLNDLYFVDPQWLCDLLAHVVTVRSVNPCIKNGVLKISDLRNQIFKGEKRFPSSMIMKYVELMSKFEVAIKISDKFLLIPSLLPDKQRECPVVAEHESPDLRTAMNIRAYLHHRVLRRQYLMSYVPSGFWARLITRLIADDRICKIVSSCYEIKGLGDFDSAQAQEDAETLMRAAPPEWACWKTGVELSCFGAKLLRVCQLENNLPFYGADDPETKVFVKNQNNATKIAVEILAPSLTLLIEKFIQFKPSEEGNDDGQNLLGFRVIGVNKDSSRTAAQLLVVTIEHIDNLFLEWFPKIDQYTDIHGFKSICRISFCDECLRGAISEQEPSVDNNCFTDEDLVEEISRNVKLQNEGELNIYHPESKSFTESASNICSVQSTSISSNDSRHASENDGVDDVFSTENAVEKEEVFDEEYELLNKFLQEGKKCIVGFELEQGSKLLLENKQLQCPIHQQVEFCEAFPDLCYLDLEENLIISPENIRQGKFLAAGAYGDVFIADILRNDNWISTAMKIPFNSEKGNSRAIMATMFSYDTYKNVRQELAILVPVNHVNIVKFLGVSLSPFAMFLELAPGGALDQFYIDYRNAGRKLHPCVIQKALHQISAAMKYLHRHHIIYRDLKCENVLVWSFPGPAIAYPESYRVLLKLTDYGISRSVSLSGIKGYLGTPGFMAPEIIRYTGKESYTVKVDCFSFGSLMYELIALQQPFSDIAQNKASLAQQYILNGKRPQLRYREKRFPILLISLLYQCWAQNPEDRPSMADINGLTSLEEFPKLIDNLGLGESFNLQCIVTANQGQCKPNVVDSRNVIGSHLWFCGYFGFGDSIAARKEGVITVFSYRDSKYTHVVNIRIKDRVCMVCSVGSTVWLGTESGLIQVFCSLTFKPLAIGRLICHRHILRILHSPFTHSVLITRSDGCVYAYNDNISSFGTFLPLSEVQNYFPNVPAGHTIRELFPNKEYTGDTKIHCFAAVSSHVKRKYSNELVTYKNSSGAITATVREVAEEPLADASLKTCGEVTYELWCGQEKGQITILDLNSLKKMKTLPVKGNDLSHPLLKDLHVTFMETSRTFESFSQEQNKPSNDANSIWLVIYPGTEVWRWNVDSRSAVSSFDASLHSPWRDLNSAKLSKKTKSMKAYDSQISSLVIVADRMYVGTTFGCLIICDAFTMDVMLSLRCYEEHIDTIIPLRMITSRYRNENEKKMVLTCGRKCLDFWIRNRKKRLVGKEMTILTWNTDEIISVNNC